VQEAIDLTVMAFDLAEKYRAIVVVLVDGSIGQMMEPAQLPPMRPLHKERPDWAITGAKGRERQMLSSIYLQPHDEEITNLRLLERWKEIEANEVRYKAYFLDDAEFAVIGFGTAGRVALSAVRTARAKGIPIGLLRPLTLSPFPYKRIEVLAEQLRAILVVEMNAGQMLDDVRIATRGKTAVEFYGRLGGVVPLPDEILAEIERIAFEPSTYSHGDPRQKWIQRLESLA
jgi:2-oxoglutarate ferredoxin oxidoreductase subunit alpha